ARAASRPHCSREAGQAGGQGRREMTPGRRRISSTMRPASAQAGTRAFTLLEVILAASIGLMVVLGAITLMLTYQQTDARLARRYEQVNDLGRIRQVMEHACSTLLMS